MKCRATPYVGEEKYIFFSYCHKDSDAVYPMIEGLTALGYRIWFDDGISAGADWTDVIAAKLEKCAVFICAITPAYCRSHNCKNELTYAVGNGTPILPLMCQDIPLISGIRLQLMSRQYIKLYEYDKEIQLQKITQQEILGICKGEPHPILLYPSTEPMPRPAAPAPETTICPVHPTPEPIPSSELAPHPMPIPVPRQEPSPKDTMVVRLSDGVILPWTEDCCKLCSLVQLSAKDGVRSIQIKCLTDVYVDGKTAKDGSPLLCEWHTVETPEGAFVIVSGKEAEWLKECNTVFYLAAERSEEVKTISVKGLSLGRHFPWHSSVCQDRRIGRKHGTLRVNNGIPSYEDHSTNGSLVNDIFTQNQTVALKDKDTICIGAETFCFHAVVLQSEEARKAQRYGEGCSLMDNGTEESFQQAMAIFTELSDYLDAAQKKLACLEAVENCKREKTYRRAAELAQEDTVLSLDEAVKLLDSLGDWKNAKELCRQWKKRREDLSRKKKEQEWNCIYQNGMTAVMENRYNDAITLFDLIPHWRSSEAFLTVCREMGKKDGNDGTVSKSEAEEREPTFDDTIREDKKTITDVLNEDRTIGGYSPLNQKPKMVIIDLATGELYKRFSGTTIIGRKQNQSDLPFPSNSRMSRQHAEIYTHNGKYFIRDCNSANGTTVNHVQLAAGEAAAVENLAFLSAGDMDFLVIFAPQAATIAEAKLIGLISGNEGISILSDQPMQLEGADPEGTLMAGNRVKRIHAQLQLTEDGAILSTQSETVGVNGSYIKPGEPTAIATDTVIQVGDTQYTFRMLNLIQI